MSAAQTIMIPVAPWQPDLPDLASATAVVVNVVPITQESYGPLPSLAIESAGELDGACIGAITVQDNGLAVNLFAGSADALFQTNTEHPVWVDVSNYVYTTAPGEYWRFCLFNGSVIATNFSNAMQSFGLGVNTNFVNLFDGSPWTPGLAYGTVGDQVIANGSRYSLTTVGTSASSGTGPSGTGVGITDGTCVWNYEGGTPPQARHICTPKNFVMVGNTNDPVGGLGPKRVWWCSNGDATTWPAPGTNAAIEGMSDYNDFQGNFGEITGLVDSLANADVAIFFSHAVWRGLFVGPPDVFDFFPAENVRGCPAPNSIVPFGSIVYYLGEDGFYAFDGAQSTPIGAERFDNWFWSNVNRSYLRNIVGAPDAVNRSIYWAFPSLQATDGVCDSVIIYRWDIQRATYGYYGPDGIEWIMRSLSSGLSLDTMPAAGYDNVDTLPASLDSPFWAGGLPSLAAFSGGAHELVSFTGPALQATVTTQTKQLTPGRRSMLQSSRPLVDLATGTPTISVAGRSQLFDPIVYGPAVAPNVAGECPQRVDARYFNGQLQIPAAAIWTHIVGMEATFIPAGTR